MNSGYYPSVVNPVFRRVQTESGGFQAPMFFGGSQVPYNLGLPRGTYSGAGFKKSTISIQKGRLAVKPFNIPYAKLK